MSVAAQRERIAAIAALIDGVATTSAALPRNLTGADLPAVIVLAGEGAHPRRRVNVGHAHVPLGAVGQAVDAGN